MSRFWTFSEEKLNDCHNGFRVYRSAVEFSSFIYRPAYSKAQPAIKAVSWSSQVLFVLTLECLHMASFTLVTRQLVHNVIFYNTHIQCCGLLTGLKDVPKGLYSLSPHHQHPNSCHNIFTHVLTHTQSLAIYFGDQAPALMSLWCAPSCPCSSSACEITDIPILKHSPHKS